MLLVVPSASCLGLGPSPSSCVQGSQRTKDERTADGRGTRAQEPWTMYAPSARSNDAHHRNLLLLVVSRVAAELAERVGQPAMIGEILAGLILGPALFGLIHESPELTAIADIGLLMLVLLAGMEIELK